MPIPAETAPQKPPRRRETAQETLQTLSSRNVPLLHFVGYTVIYAVLVSLMLTDLRLAFGYVVAFVLGGSIARICLKVR